MEKRAMNDDAPAGSMYVRRGLDGKDEAWVKVLTGWQQIEPPPRREATRDGEAEFWLPQEQIDG